MLLKMGKLFSGQCMAATRGVQVRVAARFRFWPIRALRAGALYGRTAEDVAGRRVHSSAIDECDMENARGTMNSDPTLKYWIGRDVSCIAGENNLGPHARH